jgi:hypothetical protein
MTGALRKVFAALVLWLLALAPGAAQPPAPGDAEREKFDIAQCRLQAELALRAMLAKVRLEVQPTEAQRATYDQFEAALKKAGEILYAVCPLAESSTASGRLELALKHITDGIQAIESLRPASEALFQALTDEQKSRLGNFDYWFDRMASLWSDAVLNSGQPRESDSQRNEPSRRPSLRLCSSDGRCIDLFDTIPGRRPESRWRDQDNFGRLWRE